MTLTIQYTNHYRCEDCKADWQMTWDCACNDKCPYCNKEHEPFTSDELVYMEDRLTSEVAGKIIDGISKQLIAFICKFLDNNDELEFEDTVNISYANEEMRMIVKHDEKYLLITLDNNTGSDSFQYDINDSAVSVNDLVWITEQIEKEERG